MSRKKNRRNSKSNEVLRGEIMPKKIKCPYCGEEARVVRGDIVYPHRPDLFDCKFWLCRPCWAFVGTHKNSKGAVPLGRLANLELRKLRRLAHNAFDPLWQRKMKTHNISKSKARRLAYGWLSEKLNMSVEKCHISWMSEEECRLVVNICAPYNK